MATSISSIFISFVFSTCLVSLFLLCSSKNGYVLAGRETPESHRYTLPITSLLPASVCSPATKDDRKMGSLKVVHMHGPCSPLGGVDKVMSAPTVAQILSHDQFRVNSIQSRLGFNSGRQNSLQDSLATLPTNQLSIGNYVATVGLGTPKKDLSLVFDTGSDFTWTQCLPCAGSCYKQKEAIFDPSMSQTYKNVTCDSPQCSQLTSATLNPPRCSGTTCVYLQGYKDHSSSAGYLGTETLTLSPTDVFPNFLFGCGQENKGLFGDSAGLLGLGRDPLSIVSQTASKYGKYFSYCLPTMSSSSGHLTFGKEGGSSSNALKFTPFSSNSQANGLFYFIDITGISVGGQLVSISPTVFKDAGTVIDSGTVITRLPPGAYGPLQTAFQQKMKQYPMVDDSCYDFSNYSTVSIPKISFYFSGNVEVPIHPLGILYGNSISRLCLAFIGNSNPSDVGVFGNLQQQTLEVVYDVAGGKLGFGIGGCS